MPIKALVIHAFFSHLLVPAALLIDGRSSLKDKNFPHSRLR